jgi:hypothetical protein
MLSDELLKVSNSDKNSPRVDDLFPACESALRELATTASGWYADGRKQAT